MPHHMSCILHSPLRQHGELCSYSINLPMNQVNLPPRKRNPRRHHLSWRSTERPFPLYTVLRLISRISPQKAILALSPFFE